MLVALSTSRRLSLTRAFCLGLATGLVYFAVTLYWITNVMALYGGRADRGRRLVNALPWSACRLSVALFAVVARRLLIDLAHGRWRWRRWSGWRSSLTDPCAGRFPVGAAQYSQVTTLPIAQLASVFGVYGVSALVASGGGAARRACRHARRPHRCRSAPSPSSSSRLRCGEPARRSGVDARGVEHHDRSHLETAAKHSVATRLASRQRVSWIKCASRGRPSAGARIWSSGPSRCRPIVRRDRSGSRTCAACAQEGRVSIPVGSDQVERGRPDRWQLRVPGAGGRQATVGYRKMHLVPFGEYVPLRSVLFFVGPLVEAIGSGFAAGTDATVLPVDGHPISVAICYEVVYPALVREFVLRGSELLTTITNDSWFGKTSAPYQHFAQASMRAIEEGRYLVRAANTGITGIVDPYGRVLERTGIFEQGMVVGRARFLRTLTPYARWGDVFAYASVVATAVCIVLARRRIQ